MRNKLQDEIDVLEGLRERATDIVRAALTPGTVRKAVSVTTNIPDALVLLAQLVEDDLTELTTDAFHSGVGFARARARHGRS